MSANIYNEFDELIADEGWHLLMTRQEKSTEHRTNLHLVVCWETNPLPVDQVLATRTSCNIDFLLNTAIKVCSLQPFRQLAFFRR